MSLVKIDAQLKAMGLNKKDRNTIINMVREFGASVLFRHNHGVFSVRTIELLAKLATRA